MRTNTFLFRPTVADDAGSFLRAVLTNSEHLSPWVTTPLRVTDIESARLSVVASLDDGRPARYGAFRGDELVGSAKVIACDPDVPDYEIGFWRTKEWPGVGVGRWILCNTINSLFHDGASRITLRHALTNSASARAIERVGAVREGVLRKAAKLFGQPDDVVVYGLLRDEWPTEGSLGWCVPCREF